jgi:hypothetical protein
MAFEPSVAVYDACILYPFHLRNVMIQAAVDGLVQPRWTDEIHQGWIRNLMAGTAGIPSDRLQRTRRLMDNALPAATVRAYSVHIPAVSLPDPNDRHVVAAAIASGASMILTWNIQDFPARELKKFGLRRQTPDTFLMDLYKTAPDLMVGSLANARRNLSKSRVSALEFIDILKNQKLLRLAKQIQERAADL